MRFFCVFKLAFPPVRGYLCFFKKNWLVRQISSRGFKDRWSPQNPCVKWQNGQNCQKISPQNKAKSGKKWTLSPTDLVCSPHPLYFRVFLGIVLYYKPSTIRQIWPHMVFGDISPNFVQGRAKRCQFTEKSRKFAVGASPVFEAPVWGFQTSLAPPMRDRRASRALGYNEWQKALKTWWKRQKVLIIGKQGPKRLKNIPNRINRQ